MGIQVFTFDPDVPLSESLPPEIIAAIQAIAPSVVLNNSITTAKLKDGNVTTAKIAEAAITAALLAAGAVLTAAIADGAVETDKIADAAVTAAKTGLGVLTIFDSDDNPLQRTAVEITATDYSALSPPDPNTIYLIKP